MTPNLIWACELLDYLEAETKNPYDYYILLDGQIRS